MFVQIELIIRVRDFICYARCDTKFLYFYCTTHIYFLYTFIANNFISYIHFGFNKGATALHIACEYGNVAIIDLLLSKGVPIDTQAKDGRTALYVACVEKQLKAVEYLLERGANASIPDRVGRTPLQACDDSKIQQVLRRYIA